MFNNIEPQRYHVEYHDLVPRLGDRIVCYNGKEFLVKTDGDSISFPTGTFYTLGTSIRRRGGFRWALVIFSVPIR